jgi:DNA-binding XRE family transcriptional regulator
VRKAAGYTQEQLAVAIGYSRSTVSNAEIGHPDIALEFWARCDRVLKTGRSFARSFDQVRSAERRQAAGVPEDVVRHLASRGVHQFLDIGTGIPVPGSTHEIAQEADPRSRVVYVDNDSMVLAHARALLASGPEGSCDYLDADLRDTGYLLRAASRTLDFSQPVAVLLLAVLHLIPDAGNPGGLVTELASALAPASYLAISHMTADFAPGPVAAAAAAYNAAAAVPVTARTHAQVTALFGGLSLIAPGVVPITAWRPDIADALPQPADLYGGVARTAARRR